jgi:prephenate dehydrogenase
MRAVELTALAKRPRFSRAEIQIAILQAFASLIFRLGTRLASPDPVMGFDIRANQPGELEEAEQ